MAYENEPPPGSAGAEEYAAKIAKIQQACLTPLKEDLADWLNNIMKISYITIDNFMDKLDNGVIVCRLAKIISQWCEQQLASFVPTKDTIHHQQPLPHQRAPSSPPPNKLHSSSHNSHILYQAHNHHNQVSLHSQQRQLAPKLSASISDVSNIHDSLTFILLFTRKATLLVTRGAKLHGASLKIIYFNAQVANYRVVKWHRQLDCGIATGSCAQALTASGPHLSSA